MKKVLSHSYSIPVGFQLVKNCLHAKEKWPRYLITSKLNYTYKYNTYCINLSAFQVSQSLFSFTVIYIL